MADIKYEVSKDIEKTFIGGRQHSWKFNYQFIFTKLTLEDRKLLGLKITNTVDNEEKELTGEDLANEIICSSEHCPPYATHEEVMAEIKSRMESRKRQYDDKFIITPDEKIKLITNDNVFKDVLTTINKG